MKRHVRDFVCLLIIGLLLIYGGSLLPSAMDAEAEYSREIAISRCIVNGDFDDSTEYCRAVAKGAGQ